MEAPPAEEREPGEHEPDADDGRELRATLNGSRQPLAHRVLVRGPVEGTLRDHLHRALQLHEVLFLLRVVPPLAGSRTAPSISFVF